VVNDHTDHVPITDCIYICNEKVIYLYTVLITETITTILIWPKSKIMQVEEV